MLGFRLLRFPHWRPHLREGKKIRYNPQLNLKNPRPYPAIHDFLSFKEFTGNEILFALKDAKSFRPGELPGALIELGLRKGAPEGIDWNTHPTVSIAIEEAKKRLPQSTCKLLTYYAHAANRLNITDPDFWGVLEKNIIRILPKIEPRGMANSIFALAGKGSEEFFNKMQEVLPIQIRQMHGGDLLNVVRGFDKQGIVNTALYEKWIYPQVIIKAKTSNASQISEFLQIFKKRPDCTEDTIKALEEVYNYKLEKRKRLQFGAVSSN